jgi:hypothetical protein
MKLLCRRVGEPSPYAILWKLTADRPSAIRRVVLTDCGILLHAVLLESIHNYDSSM